MVLAALIVASRRNHRLVSCSASAVRRVDALAHGGEAEIGAMCDQGGEQRPVRIGAARLVAAERLEGAGEAAPFVDILQQIFDAHARQAGADGGAQFMQRARDRHGIASS